MLYVFKIKVNEFNVIQNENVNKKSVNLPILNGK